MAYLAGDLVGRGFAVWNLEYRRIGEAGGGYPGTFLDVAKGVDYLRVLAPRYDLDLRHVVLVGHSAGGHLALWAAARPRLPAASPLFTPDPLRVSGVLSLAGIGDLAAFRESGGDVCGGPSTIDALVGADRRPAPARYADTSPAALLSGRPPQVIVSGRARSHRAAEVRGRLRRQDRRRRRHGHGRQGVRRRPLRADRP